MTVQEAAQAAIRSRAHVENPNSGHRSIHLSSDTGVVITKVRELKAAQSVRDEFVCGQLGPEGELGD